MTKFYMLTCPDCNNKWGLWSNHEYDTPKIRRGTCPQCNHMVDASVKYDSRRTSVVGGVRDGSVTNGSD